MPVSPLTPTVTVKDCVVVIVDADGVTVIVADFFGGVVTVTAVVPESLL